MHIPDGYLSPSTCATLYALAAAGWYSALKRIKRLLATRTIPLISVCGAFAFVVMMFNVPLPGGTTGHAVGVTVATIVLGPWGSILSISLALAIQALFFGDGGITTLGANCFNMAIVGSFVAYAVYRLISARFGTGLAPESVRRRRGRLRRDQRLCPRGRIRVRNSAGIVSRRYRLASLCALSTAGRDTSDDDWSSDVRRPRRSGNFRGHGCLLAACRSRLAASWDEAGACESGNACSSRHAP